MVITIDGPSGAGKTSLAKKLAKRLGIIYLDSGALYRAITLEALKKGFDKEHIINSLLPVLNLVIKIEDKMRIWVKGKEITEEIRSPEVTREIWWVCRIPEVREKVNKILKGFARRKDIVVEGRDMGSVVFPQADYKIYLTASLEERARRRWKELKANGIEITLTEIRREMEERDKKDSKRELAPLTIPPGALIIDNTHLSIDKTVDKILEFMNKNEG
ncbi:(d)CMP kinase [Candidatus Calescamantes bacterium]|nr:(d)CMP kinase [Candidatus Calescamantes bacterium]